MPVANMASAILYWCTDVRSNVFLPLFLAVSIYFFKSIIIMYYEMNVVLEMVDMPTV